jgi:hypothetical protein
MVFFVFTKQAQSIVRCDEGREAGRTSRIRRRRAQDGADTTNGLRAGTLIRLVEQSRYAARSFGSAWS